MGLSSGTRAMHVHVIDALACFDATHKMSAFIQ